MAIYGAVSSVVYEASNMDPLYGDLIRIIRQSNRVESGDLPRCLGTNVILAGLSVTTPYVGNHVQNSNALECLEEENFGKHLRV